MSARAPALSVVLPVRNGMPYLPRAVESILRQTWRDLELLVIDDGSTDGTLAYLSGILDERLKVFPIPASGLAAALNHGLAMARAPLVARQDADDWSSPDRCARQMGHLALQPDLDVLATAVSFVDANDRPVDDAWTRTVRAQWDAAIHPLEIAALMPLTCCIFHATIVARTEVLRKAGGYAADAVPAEDYDLWLRLLPHHRFGRLPMPLYTVRVHPTSSSAIRRVEQTERVIAAKLRYLRRRIPALPRPTRLALPCVDRGSALYREVAPREGFTVLDVPVASDQAGSAASIDVQSVVRSADVIAITDFSALSAWSARILSRSTHCQIGNLFARIL